MVIGAGGGMQPKIYMPNLISTILSPPSCGMLGPVVFAGVAGSAPVASVFLSHF
jgi:hypothetical protein